MTLCPRTAVLVAAALLLSGCQLRLALDVAVEADGSGRLEVAVGADQELLAEAAAQGVDPLEALRRAGAELDDQGWRVERQTMQDGSAVVRLSTRFAGPNDLAVLSAQLAEALNAPEVRLLAPLDLRVDDERLVLRGAAALRVRRAVRELGLAPREAERLLRRRDAVDYRVTVSMPAEVLETTGTVASDGAVIWQIGPGASVPIQVVGQRPTSPWPFLAAGAGVTALLLVVVLGAGSGRRRARRASNAGSDRVRQ